jgi:hypothetical protein
MPLHFEFDVIVKNSKFIEICIHWKYKVQNNILEVDKLKEVKKINFLKILCRVP